MKPSLTKRFAAFAAAAILSITLAAIGFGFTPPIFAERADTKSGAVAHSGTVAHSSEIAHSGTVAQSRTVPKGGTVPKGCTALQSGAETRPVLILMYHQFLNSRKSKYIVTPDVFRGDLRELKRRGYQSVRASELVDFVDGKGTLPKKPVLITFDDGHFSNFFYCADILKEEGFTAVESVIGRFSANSTDTGTGGNPNYSHLTWEEIGEMRASGVFEIGNHSYDMHNYHPRFGISQKVGESDDAYRSALQNDVTKLQTVLKEKSNVTPTVFAFPFGKYNTLAKETLADLGFRVMLTCNETVSVIERGDPKSLWQLGRYNRDPEYDMDAFLAKRDKTFE